MRSLDLFVIRNSEQRNVYTKLQGVFAGFLDHTDCDLGRLVTSLDKFTISSPDVMSSGGHTLSVHFQPTKSNRKPHCFLPYYPSGMPRGLSTFRGLYASLCLGAERGRFPDLSNRDELCRLLAVITVRKAIDLQRRKHGSQSPIEVEEFLCNEPPNSVVLSELLSENCSASVWLGSRHCRREQSERACTAG